MVASFAKGVATDIGAIRAAISLPWSNGETEGQITKLKLVKRQMYGRGSLTFSKPAWSDVLNPHAIKTASEPNFRAKQHVEKGSGSMMWRVADNRMTLRCRPRNIFISYFCRVVVMSSTKVASSSVAQSAGVDVAQRIIGIAPAPLLPTEAE